MPELPEVETVVRDLRPLVVGRAVRGVRHGGKKLRTAWEPAWDAAVVGRRVEGVRRRGKWIVVELEKNLTPPPPSRNGKGEPIRNPPRDRCGSPPLAPLSVSGRGRGRGSSGGPRLIVHLGMTGQFTAVDADVPAPDHLHVVFDLDGGRELRFRDPRRFGSLTLHADEAAVGAFFTANGLGPEPFGLDAEYFRTAVRGTARTLKALLLDQRLVAGVGNIYADEACSRAGLHPGRTGASLTRGDADRLREAVEAVLTAAVAGRGSTIRDYVGGSGLRGGFQHEHRVYGRTGEPCGACATAIERVVLGGRSSHFCPKCQGPGVRSQESDVRVQKSEDGSRKRRNGRVVGKPKSPRPPNPDP